MVSVYVCSCSCGYVQMCMWVPVYVGARDSLPLLFETRFLNELEALLSLTGRANEFQGPACGHSPTAGIKGMCCKPSSPTHAFYKGSGEEGT